jgi:hypothetical protein
MGKQKRSVKQHPPVDMIDRVVIWFGIALIFELYLLAVNRFYLHYRAKEIELAAGLDKLFSVMVYAALVLCVLCVVWAVAMRKNELKILPQALAVIFAVLSGSAYLFRIYGSISVRVMQIVVPVIAVLALVYHLYQKEYFAITILGGLCIFGLWLYRHAAVSHPVLSYAYMAVLIILSAATLILALILQRGNGTLNWGGEQRFILQRHAAYPMVYVTCALTVLAGAAALLWGTTVAYYAIFLIVAWIFVMAVYFTVRMM